MALASIRLTTLNPGQVGQLFAADLSPELGEEHARLLRAMGLRPQASVRVCRQGDPCIVQVGQVRGDSCRLGLSRRVADQISVCVAPEACAGEAPRA